jgi:hypothetical protein
MAGDAVLRRICPRDHRRPRRGHRVDEGRPRTNIAVMKLRGPIGAAVSWKAIRGIFSGEMRIEL